MLNEILKYSDNTKEVCDKFNLMDRVNEVTSKELQQYFEEATC